MLGMHKRLAPYTYCNFIRSYFYTWYYYSFITSNKTQFERAKIYAFIYSCFSLYRWTERYRRCWNQSLPFTAWRRKWYENPRIKTTFISIECLLHRYYTISIGLHNKKFSKKSEYAIWTEMSAFIRCVERGFGEDFDLIESWITCYVTSADWFSYDCMNGGNYYNSNSSHCYSSSDSSHCNSS